MNSIKEILKDSAHRPYEMPQGNWVYYQEWNRALFFHWIVPFEFLLELVPKELNIDVFEGNCYVSLVAFTMEKIRPKYLPSVGFISDFDEINVRTYVEKDNKKGVYFLNIEAGKLLSTVLAKSLSGLPYEKAEIQRKSNSYKSKNPKKGFSLDVEFEVKEAIQNKSELTKWLTERYCLYLDQGNKLFRYEIHHVEWPLQNIEIKKLDVQFKIGNIKLNVDPRPISQYSEGVKVVSWQRENL